MRQRISQEQKMQLLGLLTLGRDMYQKIDDIHASMGKVIGLNTDDVASSQLGDAMWDTDRPSIDLVLSRMEIEVGEDKS